MNDIERSKELHRERVRYLKETDIWLLGRSELVQLAGELKWEIASLKRQLRDGEEGQ